MKKSFFIFVFLIVKTLMNSAVMKLFWAVLVISSTSYSSIILGQGQKQTYATITNPSETIDHGTTFAQFSYDDSHGKKYYILDYNTYTTYVLGDKFVLLYDSLKPSKYSLITKSPLFLQNENTRKVTGKVVEVSSVDCKFKYSYELDSGVYNHTRYQQLDYKKKYSDVKVGNEYLVEYWVDNPLRAIIYPDQPINETNKPVALVRKDNLVYRPNQLKISCIPETYMRTDNHGKDYRIFTGDSIGKNVDFMINSYLFNCMKLEFDPVLNIYVAIHKITMTLVEKNLTIKGLKLMYNQYSGIVRMEGDGIEITTGKSTIKWIEEASIDLSTQIITYKKYGVVSQIAF
jgi:hypothetical protein